jgi:predicted small lipoprotein YifL
MKRLVVAGLLALAACGADGPPVAPTTGVTVTGEARIGAVFGG